MKICLSFFWTSSFLYIQGFFSYIILHFFYFFLKKILISPGYIHILSIYQPRISLSAPGAH